MEVSVNARDTEADEEVIHEFHDRLEVVTVQAMGALVVSQDKEGSLCRHIVGVGLSMTHGDARDGIDGGHRLMSTFTGVL